MPIRTIAIVHHVHTDFGYTDHPQRSQQEHIKYLEQAVDYVLKSSNYPEGARFAWTQEQLYPVRQWWERATQAQKQRFFAAVDTGRLEITGTAFNVTAFLNREEWDAVTNWIPEDLREGCHIRSVMQIDVNGMHTAGMIAAYNRGVRNLFIGPNSYYGVPPMPTPTAFYWQLDDKRKMFVWLNASYNNGYFLFNPNWRQGPVPNYSDLRYRAPERGDIWRADDESILNAHKICLENIAQIEGGTTSGAVAETDGFTKNRVFGGYDLQTLPVSVTSQWRFDNDPPFYPIVDFVRRWNELGLQPRLLLCTASQAMNMVREELGDQAPVYSGEWIDWWANGNASSPREMSYNREAKRILRAAKSPLFGKMEPQQLLTAHKILEDICLYDEHCFGSWQSVSNPYSFENLSQTAEKKIYAYRALDGAQCLLADRVRILTKSVRNQIIIWNPTKFAITELVELPIGCMRGAYGSVHCVETGESWPILLTDGVSNFLRPKDPSEFGPENVSRTFGEKCKEQAICFGPVTIPGMSLLHLIPEVQQVERYVPVEKAYVLEKDENGWPIYLKFAGQSTPLISGTFGSIIAVRADGFAPRWTFKDIFENDNEDERRVLRAEHLCEISAYYEKTIVKKTTGQIIFEQVFTHDSVQYGTRVLTVDLLAGRAKLELRINRRSNFLPEVLFLRFDAPGEDTLPVVSNASVLFRPEAEQFPGSCKDFYAIDGWLHYPNGWFLNCRDNALVTFGSTSVVARKTSTDGPGNHIFVRLFDNIWDTNFCANECGIMHFRFTVAADVQLKEAEELCETMNTDPIIEVKIGYTS